MNVSFIQFEIHRFPLSWSFVMSPTLDHMELALRKPMVVDNLIHLTVQKHVICAIVLVDQLLFEMY